MSRHTALLVVSFGGPEAPEDVMPFLENVTRGRGIPTERLEAVAHHYHHFGGKSPINDQNRELIRALEADFKANGIELPVYFGNRNWKPYLADAIADMKRDGVAHALALITSAYSSYSGCRQYRSDIEAARLAVGDAPQIEPMRRFFNHPGFVDACTERVRDALSELEQRTTASTARGATLVFTAHSIPESMAANCDYEAQLRSNAELIAERLGHTAWDLAWQSRSGPPHVPWLGPDICDHLKTLRARGVSAVVIAPIGFLSDHMEVLYDLDVEARAVCDEVGLAMARAGTAGSHPRLIQGLRELVLERTNDGPVLSVGPLPPRPTRCADDCCPAPVRLRPRS